MQPLKRELLACRWRFSPPRIQMLQSELVDWQKHYLPPKLDLKGKTVLDVGAGEGETAFFFLRNGAAQVTCIEVNQILAGRLRYNAVRHPELKVIEEPFSLRHLALKHDFLKVDVEGYEETLLTAAKELVAPAVVEVHGLQLVDRFEAAGWRIVNPHKTSHGRSQTHCNRYAYWMC